MHPLADAGGLVSTTIQLTQGKVAVIDDEDAERCAKHKWFAVKTARLWYAQTRIGPRHVYLHRFLFSHLGERLDHINGDGLDNRQENIRAASHRQNMANRRKPQWRDGRQTASRFKGVYRNGTRWQARIEQNDKSVYLGSFEREEDAGMAYNQAALERFGAFARMNEIAI